MIPGRVWHRLGAGRLRMLLAMLVAAVALPARAAKVERDVEYARIDGRVLALDLHLPEGRVRPPLIVWVHGGAWRTGSKASMPLADLVDEGFVVASVDYRLSTEARFPAQVHDIKAAIRFLRAEGGRWNLATNRIVIAGASAGGHLAALVGVSAGNPALEGTVGGHPDRSSAVQGIISFYGAANLTTILAQSTPHGLGVRVPALELLLGAQPEALPEVARLASPVFQVDAGDPPLLLLHGDQDPQMPVNQTLELWGAYRRAGLAVNLEIVPGAAHGGAAFHDPERRTVVRDFLRRHFGESPR